MSSRVEKRQDARAHARATSDELRANNLLDREPDGWLDDEMAYPPRVVRRALAKQARAAAKPSVITERQNRSDIARAAKTERARRVRQRRRAERIARRAAR